MELMKLDDLHKKGILTDAEFESQKTKLLEAN
jgi:Short C-terminal domain